MTPSSIKPTPLRSGNTSMLILPFRFEAAKVKASRGTAMAAADSGIRCSNRGSSFFNRLSFSRSGGSRHSGPDRPNR